MAEVKRKRVRVFLVVGRSKTLAFATRVEARTHIGPLPMCDYVLVPALVEPEHAQTLLFWGRVR